MFQRNLKLLRIRAGLSQGEAAERIGITPASYSLLENGRRNPRIETLEALRNAFDCSIDKLMFGTVDVIWADDAKGGTRNDDPETGNRAAHRA